MLEFFASIFSYYGHLGETPAAAIQRMQSALQPVVQLILRPAGQGAGTH